MNHRSRVVKNEDLDVEVLFNTRGSHVRVTLLEDSLHLMILLDLLVELPSNMWAKEDYEDSSNGEDGKSGPEGSFVGSFNDDRGSNSGGSSCKSDVS